MLRKFMFFEQKPPERKNTITARKLEDYCANLEVSAKFLSGKRVLNFGCGGSNLRKDMEAKPYFGDGSKFVEVDIENEPFSIHGNHLSLEQEAHNIRLKKVRDQEIVEGQLLIPQIKLHENRLLGIDGRKFIQIDGASLPFPGRSFDVCLALWSTYQVPDWEQNLIFKEMVRVADILHIGPVDGMDMGDIREACDVHDSTIISVTAFGDDVFYKLDTIDDYKNLALAQEPPFRPVLDILKENSSGFTNASSDETARVIIVRNDLLK
jgi:hypothetical protein